MATKIGVHQRRHFAKMDRAERGDAIRDFERQISVLALSQTKAAEEKRAELQARIDHLMKLNARGK